jgi:hypothetical protein
VMEPSRHRQRNALLFLLVCAIHGVLCWLLLASNRLMKSATQARSFTLLVLPPARPTSTAPLTNERAVPPTVRRPNRHIVAPEKDAESSPSVTVMSPPIDWQAELIQAGKAAADKNTEIPTRDFGFPARSPTLKDYPQFDWDYARTHRVEQLPEGGGLIIHLNENCFIMLNPFPFPFCSPFKHKAKGDLFKHMHDPDKPGDPNIP